MSIHMHELLINGKEKAMVKLYDSRLTKVMCSVFGASVGALAMQIPASAEGDTTITTGLSTWTSILSTVWTIITGNPLLSALVTACLLFIGFRLFKAAK